MNHLSHKQAVKLIHRRLDGLLKQKQLSWLDEHLRSCDSCAAYAAEIDLLPARLQNEFHARWDEKPGPSEKVMQHVTRKARNISMRNRISSSFKLLAGVATLLVLGFAINFVISQWQGTSTTATGTETATVLPRAEDRLLAFASTQNGNSDIYTMHADGSGLTNLTNDPAYDGSPFWSPDGKQIAFVSDRSGSPQIYLMDADGSNGIQLTDGEAQHQFPNADPWSPDGSRLLFTEWSPKGEKWTLSVIGVDGKNKTPLAEVPNNYINPSWSPDGQQVAFLADDPQNLGGNRIYIVGADGHNRRDLTASLQVNEQLSTSIYDWSADGRSIFFVSFLQKTDPVWTVYEARLDDSSLVEHVTTNAPMLDWWNDVSVTGNFNDASTFSWTRSNETVNTLHPYENCQSFDAARSGSYLKRSPNGTWLISTYCPNGDAWFYWISSNGTITRQLLDFPIPSEQDIFLDLVWSPDDRFVAINMFSNNLTEMYILDIAASLNDPSTQPLKMESGSGPSWQPVLDNKVAEEKPTPAATHPSPSQADNRLLAFTSIGEDGNLDIYTIHPDGSALTNLTNNPAYDANPFWSPDGKHIAFESNREGLDHIYLMNADGSEVTRLTDGEARYEIGATYGMNSTPWSPDGNKLIVSLWPPGETTRTLYVMNVAGGNKMPLVSQPSSYFSFPSWSPDSQRITFIADDPTNPAATHLHIVNADGSQPVDVGQFLPENESLWAYNSYSWSQDGQSVFFIAYRYSDPGQNEWIVYEFSLPGNQLIEHARSSEPIGDWWQGTSFLTGAADDRSAVITWLHRDGTSTALKPFEKCELANQYSYTYQRSSHGNLIIAAHCPNEGWWLYRADDDGTAIQQLLDAPIVAEDFRFPDIAWSPDDRFITFKVKSGILTDLYLLDVEAALQSPSTQPLKATTMGGETFYNPSWQPIP